MVMDYRPYVLSVQYNDDVSFSLNIEDRFVGGTSPPTVLVLEVYKSDPGRCT